MELHCRSVLRACARIVLAVAFCGVAILGGCTSVPSRSPIAPRDADGAVFFKVTDNYALEAWELPSAFLAVRRVADAASPATPCYWLRPGRRGLAGSTFLAGALPPGTYEFPNLGLPGEKLGSGCDHHGPASARFSVARGRLTYLGVWTQEKASGNQQAIAVVDDGERAHLEQSVPGEFPELARLVGQPPLGFLTPKSADQNEKIMQQIVRRGFDTDARAENASGTWFYGTRTGAVRRWREGENAAPAVDTGYRVSIEAIAVLSDSSVLAGGEQSTLLLSQDQGATWTTLDVPLPYGVIFGLAVYRNDVVLALLDKDDVHIYRSDASLASWNEVAGFHTEFAFFSGVPNIRPAAFVSGSSLVISLPSRHMAIYDMATGASATRDLPGAIQLFGMSGDGALHCKCAPVIITNPYESHDLGKTWAASTHDRYSLIPAMRDHTTGMVWTKDGIDRTRDGGHTWARVSRPSGAPVSLFYSQDGKQAFATDGVSMWQSANDGGTWTRAFMPGMGPLTR